MTTAAPEKDPQNDASDPIGMERAMKGVLFTGMSGTGKPAAIRELAIRGYAACDLDTSEWPHWVEADPADELTARGKDWVWREDRVRRLLWEPREETLFIGGCAQNMGLLRPLIDTIILPSAPVATIMERLAARSPAGYGHSAEARHKVSELISTIEGLLKELRRSRDRHKSRSPRPSTRFSDSSRSEILHHRPVGRDPDEGPR